MNISEFTRLEEENIKGAPPSSADNPFERDNFVSRRTTGHNAYDPDSLLTGAEIAAGLGYANPRVWSDEETYRRAVAGKIPVEDIPTIAPRNPDVRVVRREHVTTF